MSDSNPCPLCGTPLKTWVEMSSDTGVSYGAVCKICKEYIIPEGLMERVKALAMPERFNVAARVNSRFRDTGEPVVITEALIAPPDDDDDDDDGDGDDD